MYRLLPILLIFFYSNCTHAQKSDKKNKDEWVDSVYQSLTPEQRIAQLMIVRLSTIEKQTMKVSYLYDEAAKCVEKFNVGGLCVFQGRPDSLAIHINKLQEKAKTPLLVSIDGEWGLGMRLFDQVMPLPKQMMLGALTDSSIIYRYGKLVAAQCKRMGIHMNYAPVIDINNNPNNPVINDRSFGESKEKVAQFGKEYMKGLQENGILACAKHFPGHGDVSVDSHFDLPIINKSKKSLDSLELYPFKKLIQEGIGSIMVAHLFIPSIDSRANRPTSLSVNNIQKLLRDEMKFEGLVVTDAMEMMGVKKFFPNGEGSVEALVAGADMLCLPDSIEMVISKIKKAISKNKLSWKDIEYHCKKVLQTKFRYNVIKSTYIDTLHLTNDLNKGLAELKQEIAEKSVTLLSHNQTNDFRWNAETDSTTAYLGIGLKKDNRFSSLLQETFKTGNYFFDFSKHSQDSMKQLASAIKSKYKRVIIGIHQINRAPANNFGISKDAIDLIETIRKDIPTLVCLFGNAYAAKNWENADNLLVAYEDDSITHKAVIRLISGEIPFKGKLPVSVSDHLKYGKGLNASLNPLPFISPEKSGIDKQALSRVDSIVQDGIQKKAMPGCSIMIVKNGKIVFDKPYGHMTYLKQEKVNNNTVYDLASLTKILSTSLCVMKLYDDNMINLDSSIGKYLPSLRGSNKEHISIKKLLLHEAGLKSYIPYYLETIDTKESPLNNYYCNIDKDCYTVRVADKLMIRADLPDTFYKRIIESPIENPDKYVYSDNDFIILGKMVEHLSQKPLNETVHQWFYAPMGLDKTGYLPLTNLHKDIMAPTISQSDFRNQELRGDVHDQGAALMGGVAGHAGLFSDSYGVACIMQMLLNKGEWNGKRYFKQQTVDTFTTYQSNFSRRGLGFDKPEKNNKSRIEPYPAQYVSDATFGHTGFTGTCTWADPATGMIFVFLSNRIYPSDNGVFKTLNIRSKIHDTFALLYNKQNDAAN